MHYITTISDFTIYDMIYIATKVNINKYFKYYWAGEIY